MIQRLKSATPAWGPPRSSPQIPKSSLTPTSLRIPGKKGCRDRQVWRWVRSHSCQSRLLTSLSTFSLEFLLQKRGSVPAAALLSRASAALPAPPHCAPSPPHQPLLTRGQRHGNKPPGRDKTNLPPSCIHLPGGFFTTAGFSKHTSISVFIPDGCTGEFH